METNPITASRNFGGAQRGVAALAIVGIAVGAACFAHAQSDSSPYRTPGSAAKLGKPQPITDPQSQVITRGLAPEASVPGQSNAWMSQPSSPTVRPLNGNSPYPQQSGQSITSIPNTVPAKKPSMMDSAWSSLKDVVVGKPTPQPMTQPAPSPMLKPQLPAAYSPQNSGVYAGPPAYRWYGWGTTTPGANAHAPNGHYPRGSANWYTQTGATPGAFPVTVSRNGARVVANEPPAYVGGSTLPLNEPFFPTQNSAPMYAVEPMVTTTVPTPVMTYTAPAPPTVTSTPVPLFVPPPSTPMPVFTPPTPSTALPMPAPVSPTSTLPINTVTVPTLTPISNTVTTPPAFEVFPTPTIVPSSAISEVPLPNGVTWQSSANTDAVAFTPSQPTTALKFNPILPAVATQPKPIAPSSTNWVPSTTGSLPQPIGRSQEPNEPTVVTLPAAIRNASYGWATITEVNHVSPSRILIRLVAACDADARAASECISRLPQLKEFTVDFEAKIGSR